MTLVVHIAQNNCIPKHLETAKTTQYTNLLEKGEENTMRNSHYSLSNPTTADSLYSDCFPGLGLNITLYIESLPFKTNSALKRFIFNLV